jgi:hypothetical protein
MSPGRQAWVSIQYKQARTLRPALGYAGGCKAEQQGWKACFENSGCEIRPHGLFLLR